MIFLPFSLPIRTLKKATNKGGDCTIIFLGVFENNRKMLNEKENDSIEISRTILFLELLGYTRCGTP